jgi:nicotinamidase/pyrazinamidase
MASDPTTTLILVDVQKDFHPGGSLAIPTADEDAARIAKLLTEHPSKINRVVATMDSHQKLHIAHPGFWLSGEDSKTHPSPFTIISSQDIVGGKWKPRTDLKIPPETIDGSIFAGLDQVLDSNGMIDLYKYTIEYTKRLEAKGKFKLCIWPEHCLIGSPGHCMVDVVFEAVQQWSQSTGGSVEWVLKGDNLLTESYSAIEAEVPVDKATSFASALQTSLEESDHLILCGQAMSHCVAYTARSIVERWPKDKIANITLLTDCASSVPGFEAAGDSFQKEMSDLGVKLKASTELFA